MQTLKTTWSLALAAAVLTAACGDSKSSLNPTAPSAISASSLAADSGDITAESGSTARGGNGKGNGNGGNGNGNGGPPTAPGNGGAPSSNTSPSAPGQGKVEIEGLISAVGSNSITVNGQTVGVNADTVIRHGNRRFELSELSSGDRVHVRATRMTAAVGALAVSLVATEIKLQNPDGDDGDDDDDDDGAPTSLVSVVALDASASEVGPNTGTFRLTRTGDLTQLASPLAVSFTLTGTATNGTDYTNLPLTANFAAGLATADVVVTPIADALAEVSETVVLTLTSAAGYELGSPVSATIDISDNGVPLVNVSAVDASAQESGNTGTFRLTRTGSLAASLTVEVTITGTATNGTDYESLPTVFTFPAGSSTLNVFVVPIADAVADASETVTLTIVDTAAYNLGSTPSATITLAGS